MTWKHQFMQMFEQFWLFYTRTIFVSLLCSQWWCLYAHLYSSIIQNMTVFWIWYGSRKQHILFGYSKWLKCGICHYYLGFRSVLWACIGRIQNIHLSWCLHHSLQHKASGLFTISSVCCHGYVSRKPTHQQLQGWCSNTFPKEKPTFLTGRRNF